jgi:hypothetical protein
MTGGVAHVVVVPSTLALLPSYAGIVDPLPDLRAACRDAVRWLAERHPSSVRVVAADGRSDNVGRGVPDPAGVRVARHLLAEAGFGGWVDGSAAGVLVVANGTATRDEQAPGHLDARAAGYDDVIEAALRDGDAAALRGLDAERGRELWCYDVPALQVLGGLVDGAVTAATSYADDPYGVRYWVVRWSCGS